MTATLTRTTECLQLRNGITLLVTPNPTIDLVAARCFLKYGTQVETPEQAGLVHLVATLLTKGTTQYTAQEIAEQVESLGAVLNAEAANDYLLLSLKALTTDFPELLALTAEILRNATFPESELQLERHLTLQAIKAQQERPFALAYDRLQALLYGDHPYGLPILGLSHTVARLEHQHLRHYQQQYLHPAHLVISIAGNITTAQGETLVNQYFQDWLPPPPPTPPTPPLLTPSPQIAQIPLNNQQIVVMLGYPAPAVTSPHYPAMKLIATYLGSGLSSRLFVELREKRGLAYEVSAFFPTRQYTSQLVCYMGTAPHNQEIAITGLQQECDRLAQEPLSEEELQTVKSKLLGQYALSKQTNSQLAQTYGWYTTLGLGIDFDLQFTAVVQALTPQDLQHTAQTYFTQPTIVLVGGDQLQ
ncbi:MAG: M16 family metallopeptidase [Pseudanabaenaceae cyanobacterium]